MERLKRDGWEVYGPAETVKCPSTYTVRRDDRRGGPLTSQQILRRGQPTKWDPSARPRWSSAGAWYGRMAGHRPGPARFSAPAG
jgi:hypothetical protein